MREARRQIFDKGVRHVLRTVANHERGNQFSFRIKSNPRPNVASVASRAIAIAPGVKQLGIDVRASVHTGECEMMGDNVGGIAVNLGARVMSKAEPGSGLVSGTVKDLVAGSGIDFKDMGTHVLKGIPGELRLFAAQS